VTNIGAYAGTVADGSTTDIGAYAGTVADDSTTDIGAYERGVGESSAVGQAGQRIALEHTGDEDVTYTLVVSTEFIDG